jgi:hypothetical protein
VDSRRRERDNRGVEFGRGVGWIRGEEKGDNRGVEFGRGVDPGSLSLPSTSCAHSISLNQNCSSRSCPIIK